MKYLKALYFLARVVVCGAVILGGARLAGTLCAATSPPSGSRSNRPAYES